MIDLNTLLMGIPLGALTLEEKRRIILGLEIDILRRETKILRIIHDQDVRIEEEEGEERVPLPHRMTE